MRSVFLNCVCVVLLLAVITSASPWLAFAEDGMLDRRAGAKPTLLSYMGRILTLVDTTPEPTSSEAASNTASSEPSETSHVSSETKTASDKTDAKTDSKTHSKTDSKSNSQATATSSISINPAAGAGGFSMITPAATTTTYYKIGQNVTFAWNYTSLTITPSAVDVLASCSANSATYTLTSNMTVKETGSVVWDTNATQTIPFLTATYTLFVVDSNKTIGDVVSAGHLGSQIGFNFGMYWPQKPTPLNSM